MKQVLTVYEKRCPHSYEALPIQRVKVVVGPFETTVNDTYKVLILKKRQNIFGGLEVLPTFGGTAVVTVKAQ